MKPAVALVPDYWTGPAWAFQLQPGLFIGVPFSGFAVPYFLLEYPRFPGLFQCSTLSAMGIGVSERPSPAYGQVC